VGIQVRNDLRRRCSGDGQERSRQQRQDHPCLASSRRAQLAGGEARNAEPVPFTSAIQTLVEIAAEKNSTIIFPKPVDWLKALMGERKS
jgi:hypothetical protein